MPTDRLAALYEPKLSQDVLTCADVWQHIRELNPHQQGVLGQRKDAVIALGEDDHLLPGLLLELAPPALPADGLSPTLLLLARPPGRRRQGEHQQGQQDVHPHGPRGFLGRTFQTPLWLALLDTALLDETASIVIIKGPQGLIHRSVGQEHGFAPQAPSACPVTGAPPR
jgi:hypothetical protein